MALYSLQLEGLFMILLYFINWSIDASKLIVEAVFYAAGDQRERTASKVDGQGNDRWAQNLFQIV